jgi:uncharacterized protein YlxW (UPF0749 family)
MSPTVASHPRSQPPVQPQVRGGTTHVGLLTEIMSNTLDEDYRVAADKAKQRRTPAKRSSGLTVAVVVLMFGGMLGISALRTEQQRPVAQAERDQLVDEIHQRQDRLDGLHAQLATLESTVASLQNAATTARTVERDTVDRATQVAAVTGAGAAAGPGISIVIDDARGSRSGEQGGVILDTDLQSLVNALWIAGAEAIAIDGHRLTTLSAIRFAGDAITVDYRSLTPPYVVDAIGNPDTLPARLLETPGGQAWMGLKANYGIRFDTTTSSSLMLPADPTTQLRQARPVVRR